MDILSDSWIGASRLLGMISSLLFLAGSILYFSKNSSTLEGFLLFIGGVTSFILSSFFSLFVPLFSEFSDSFLMDEFGSESFFRLLSLGSVLATLCFALGFFLVINKHKGSGGGKSEDKLMDKEYSSKDPRL